jgi:phosphoribosylglycinamide formyltransferase-1
MQIGFYTSNKATRLIKVIEALRTSENDDLLNSIGVIIYDGNDPAAIEYLSQYKRFINLDYEGMPKEDNFRGKYLSYYMLKQSENYGVEYWIINGARILAGELLTVFKNKIINFHPSLLPSFPGINSIDQAREYGSLLSGYTAHFVDDRVDSGPIILQEACALREYSNDQILDLQVGGIIKMINILNSMNIEIEGRNVYIKPKPSLRLVQ